MVTSPTAEFLAQAIHNSPLTQRKIAQQAGFKNANILSMLKTGETKVPLDRIPALSSALNVNTQEFLFLAIQEYHPSVHEVLTDVLGLPLSDAEIEILGMFRLAYMQDDLEVETSFKKIFSGVVEMLSMFAK